MISGVTADTQSPSITVRPGGPFPQDFGRYILLQRLGGGAMATVYLAEDTRLDKRVALKVPHPHLLHDPDTLGRFYREARTAARLCHPYLCQVFDVDQFGGNHFLTMRYIEGKPLSMVPPGDLLAVAELTRKLAEALAEAHRLGVVHRDLKPANILITPQGDPVVTDFGMALRLGAEDVRLTQSGTVLGTPLYMAPEQFRGDQTAMGPACDIYSLGVILYEMLTGRTPFQGPGLWQLQEQVLHATLVPPSALRPDLDPRLEAVCVQALARDPAERFATMKDVAAALSEFLRDPAAPPTTSPKRERGETGPGAGASGLYPLAETARPRQPLLRRVCIRFAFAGPGERPAAGTPQDRLYLELGQDLRPGVIDHHHLTAYSGSTASLVLAHPDLVSGAVNPARAPDARFVIVLHRRPDLDGVASAWLAISYLTTGSFPDGAEALARYLDKVDDGSVGMTLANPFSLYSAFRQLGNRLHQQPWNSEAEHWQESVRQGLELTGFVVGRMTEEGTPLPEVDAFACPGMFTQKDRDEVLGDIERYRRKLALSVTMARRATLRLPGQFGGKLKVESLLVRHVQGAGDPQRCLFFRSWARTDAQHCPNGRGFVALCEFIPGGQGEPRRCMLSVTPDSGASLRGLGVLLDQAEAQRREAVHGVDDRVTDPATGTARPPRPGYANADPWYDGRAHGYTYVDAPRSGTLLTVEEIETIFLRFGGSETEPQPL
jgi:hypothetical protein